MPSLHMCCFSLICAWLLRSEAQVFNFHLLANDMEWWGKLIIEKAWLQKWNFKMKFQYDSPPSNSIFKRVGMSELPLWQWLSFFAHSSAAHRPQNSCRSWPKPTTSIHILPPKLRGQWQVRSKGLVLRFHRTNQWLDHLVARCPHDW